ncbi:MAG: hypothetical protein IPI12_01745 [Ignavibacteriales bacterium]|nr:hypothetical protein [Ignavibacteriales bacterium]
MNKWLLENHQVMRGLCEYIYEECQFKKEISISYDAQAEGIENPLFDQSHFEDKIRLQNTSFESMVFSNNLEQKTQHSDKLLIEIDGCVFNKMFALSALSFADINVKQSQFKSDFWLKSCKIKNLQITSTVFDASTDFEGSTFDNFFISRTIFKDFASFVDCKFGDSDESSIENRTTFDFVTFLGFCSFRSSNFNQGLNLQNTSMKETLNFHGLYLDKNLTNRNPQNYKKFI